jgi:hypothetical protein
MGNRRKKIALFKNYSNNFKIVAAHPYYNWAASLPECAYLCPICFNFFEHWRADKTKSNYLTFEHIPQKKAGGQPDILTCHLCNQLHSPSDRELSLGLKNISFLRNDTGAKLSGLEIKAGGKVFKGDVVKEKSKQIKVLINNTSDLHEVVELINRTKDFSITGPNADARSLRLAILKSAYLLAFKRFGYGFILHSSFNPIREQLLNPASDILPSFGVLFGNPKKGIYVIKQPEFARSLFVNFELKINKGSFFAGALIPTPSENVVEFYRNVKPMTEGQTDVTIANIHDLMYLSSEQAVFYHYSLNAYLG